MHLPARFTGGKAFLQDGFGDYLLKCVGLGAWPTVIHHLEDGVHDHNWGNEVKGGPAMDHLLE